MMHKIIVLVFIIITLAACSQNNTNKTQEVIQTEELGTSVHQISADNEVEIQFNPVTRELSVLINGKACNSTLNLPDDDFLEVYEATIEVDDYNFDGYKDFALVGGYRNTQYFVNLFNPQSKQFVGFETFDNLHADTENKQLISHNIWSAGAHHTDIFVVHNFDKLELSKRIEQAGYGGFFDIDNGEIGDLALIETMIQGTDTNRMMLTEEGDPASYTIKGERACLYHEPDDSHKTSMYLVAGDKVELLDIAEGFFKINFNNPNHGNIVKWIKYSNGMEQP